MRSRENELFGMLVLALVSLIVLICFSVRSRLRPRPPRRLPLTLARLKWIAYGKSLLRRLLFVPPALLFVQTCIATGRMNWGAGLATLAVLMVLPLADALFILRLQRRPMKALPPELISAMEEQLSGKELIYSGGAWGYMDGGWYICVGRDVCAVLWAGCIDFSVPVGYRQRLWKASGRYGHVNVRSAELIFARRSGGSIIIRSEITPALQKWIRDHKGRIQ